jgi:hypothetical protein
MKRMLEFIFVLLMLVSSSLAIGNTPCSVIDGDDALAERKELLTETEIKKELGLEAGVH